MKKNYFFKRLAILASVFLLAMNGFLGAILTHQSSEALRTQIRERMLDISESAAALLDGDALEKLTAEDEGTKDYQIAMDTLRVFQEQVDLAYIYGIRDMGDGTFTFTIDPTVDDPAAFGESVEYTEALYSASCGTSAVDEIAYEDRWGRFYSAYSPVFDSEGHVGGIVGVDFDAEWYENQIRRHRYTILVISLFSLLMGALIVFLITGRLRRYIIKLNQEMSSLAGDMEALSKELRLASGKQPDGTLQDRDWLQSLDSGDLMQGLGTMVHEVREEMHQYIIDAHELAYKDTMTGTGNRTAYFGMVDRVNRQIRDNSAGFSIAVFDINGLKRINDEQGHESGDKLIIDAASCLVSVFHAENLYRIGGDEFVAILEHASAEMVQGLFEALDRKLALMNRDRDIPVAISKGMAVFIREEDEDFNGTFRRADKAMYEDKAGYYLRFGDRRRRSGE